MDSSIFIDDGIIIKTDEFNEEEVLILIQILLEKFKIKSFKFLYKGKFHRIVIKGKEFELLKQVLSSYVIKSMRPFFKL